MATGEWRDCGPFAAAAGAISVALTGTGDTDLYVRVGARPTLNSWDCRPYRTGSGETCELQGPAQFYVSVFAYRAATVQLKVKYFGEGG